MISRILAPPNLDALNCENATHRHKKKQLKLPRVTERVAEKDCIKARMLFVYWFTVTFCALTAFNSPKTIFAKSHRQLYPSNERIWSPLTNPSHQIPQITTNWTTIIPFWPQFSSIFHTQSITLARPKNRNSQLPNENYPSVRWNLVFRVWWK